MIIWIYKAQQGICIAKQILCFRLLQLYSHMLLGKYDSVYVAFGPSFSVASCHADVRLLHSDQIMIF